MMEEVSANSEDSTINPVDCYRHFITDEIISLMVRETNRHVEQHVQTQKLIELSNIFYDKNWQHLLLFTEKNAAKKELVLKVLSSF